MKTLNPKMTEKQDVVTAMFVIAALISFFAVIIHNIFSYEIGI